MEPKLPVPNSPEAGAYNPQVLPPRPEAFSQHVQTEVRPERPSLQEQQSAISIQGAAPSLPAPAAQQPAQISVPAVPLLRPLTSSDDNPTVAGDEEVIEKVWVDKAKKIITQTKDDPYKQEQEVSRLQADYLKKRYGKDIKATNG